MDTLPLAALSARFTWIDWLVVIGYLVITTWLGTRLAGKQATIRDFFLGGRKLPWYAVSGSIIATEISAVTFVIVPFIVFHPGGNFTYLQLGIFGSFLARIIVGYVLVPAYYEREIYSPYDYMANRLGGRVRGMTTALFGLGGILAQSARVYLTAEILKVVLSGPLEQLSAAAGLSPLAWAIIFIAIVAIAWTLIGGITTVVWTDAILFLVFLVGSVVALITVGVELSGGFAEMFRMGWQAKESGAWGKFTFFDFDPDPRTQYTIWTAVIASTWGGLGAYGTDQLIAQRMFCCRNQRDARWAIISSSASQLVTIMVALVGVGIYAYYKQPAETAQPAPHAAAVAVEHAGEPDVALEPDAATIGARAAGDISAAFPDAAAFAALSPDEKREVIAARQKAEIAAEFPRLRGDALDQYAEKGDRIFPIFIVEAIPQGLSGLIIAGIFAAAVSSLTSILAALSQTTMSAFYIPLRQRRLALLAAGGGRPTDTADAERPSPSDAEDRRSVFVGRVFVLFWGVALAGMAFLAQAAAEHYKSILDLALAMAGYAGGALLAGFALSFLPLKIDGRGFMYSGPLSVVCVFGLVWHQPWTHAVCWAFAVILLLVWFWNLLSAAMTAVELKDPQERSRRALAVALRDVPQTLVLIGGLALLLWLNYNAYWLGEPDELGERAMQGVAWPWQVPVGSTIAFIWGYLLARRRTEAAT